MRLRIWLVGIVLATGLATTVAMASPMLLASGELSPLSEWKRVPSATRCTFERAYGDASNPTSLGVHQSISGRSFQIDLVISANGPRDVEELPAVINVAGARIERWSLLSVSDQGTQLSLKLTPQEMSKIITAKTAKLRVDGRIDQSFNLDGINEASRQLAECIGQLRQTWRVGLSDAPEGIRGPRDDLRTPFAAEAQRWAQLRIRPGTVRFVVLVDEGGRVADCDVQEPSDAPMLEKLGCELINGTKAEPARDQTGKAVKDSFGTPPIVR